MSYERLPNQETDRYDGEEIVYGPCSNSNRDGYSYVYFPRLRKAVIIENRYVNSTELRNRRADFDKWSELKSHHGIWDNTDLWNI